MNVSDYLSKSEFYEARKNSKSPRIFVFVASWCGFCRRFVELVRNFESRYDGEVQLVDTDSEGETLWEEYSIGTVPTLVVIKDSEVIFRKDGRPMAGLAKGDLERAVSEALAAA